MRQVESETSWNAGVAGDGVDLELDVNDRQRIIVGLDQGRLRGFVARTLAREGVESAEISILIVDDPTIRGINREHLSHDWETDVITFPLSDPADRPLCGELVVSAEMAKATAESVGADPWAEFALYVVHGLLHLVGHDDTTIEGAALMRRREGLHLAAEGLDNTFGLVSESEGEGEPCPA